MVEFDDVWPDRAEGWAFYERQHAPDIPWWKAARAIRRGVPVGEFFTLPWWSTERQTKGFLIGAHHNERRLRKLDRAHPGGFTAEGEPWHVGILYPGIPDEYSERPVGVVTRKGHIGCLSEQASTGGLDVLISTNSHGFAHVCVPVFIEGDDARVPLPYGPDVSPFDDPWVAVGLGNAHDRVLTPLRINRSHLMGLHLAQYGRSATWMNIARDLARLTVDHGVTVLGPLPLQPGDRVVNDVRGQAGFEFVNRICCLVNLPVDRRVNDETSVVVTRYLHSTSAACQEARQRGIPIYRADGFGGGIAEALRLGFM